MSFLKKLFGGQKKQQEKPDQDFSQEQWDLDYEQKTIGLEAVLGKMHESVGHAIIPFSIGGAVDMYYFANHIPGTGFATMELLDPNGEGPKPNNLGTYELVGFTRHQIDLNEQASTSFNQIDRRMCGIFTRIGNYSSDAVLKPGDTCEVPTDDEENRCIIFDHYNPNGIEFKIGDKTHHLLLCLEVFPKEMDYARENGSSRLLSILKEKNCYPYSDLDRQPVV
jgi:hypothetical protein